MKRLGADPDLLSNTFFSPRLRSRTSPRPRRFLRARKT
jgi:hypothetical protein